MYSITYNIDCEALFIVTVFSYVTSIKKQKSMFPVIEIDPIVASFIPHYGSNLPNFSKNQMKPKIIISENLASMNLSTSLS